MASRTRLDRERVADALHSAAIHLLRRLRREDDRAGISAAKLSALSVLVFRGSMRLTDLAAMEQVKPPTMTRLVAAMARDGLVRRRVDLDDARAVRLEATPRGSRILQDGRRRRIRLLASAMEGLTPGELAALGEAAALIDALSRRL